MADVHEAMDCPNCGARLFKTDGVPDECESCLYAHRECSECGSRRTLMDVVPSVEFGDREKWYEDVKSWFCLDCGAGGVEGG